MQKNYDVIVVGGGHAGCEAAMAASRMGSSVLLISMDMNKFAQMSCNPAIGGIAKGQIVSLPDHHHLLEFSQTHVHRVRDAIQPSHPGSSPFSSCPQSLPGSESSPMSQFFT